MAFNDPPSILGGITQPRVIETPGAGDAMAGGLSTVLAAILQKQQMDQQHMMQQADLAQKQAQTEHELKLADLTGADTANKKEELKENKQKFQDTQDAQNYERTGFGFLMSHLDKANDLHGLLTAAQSAADSGAIDPKVVPYVGGALQKYQGILEQQGKAAQEQAKGNVAGATQGADIAAANLKPADIAAGIRQKSAQATEAGARTANLNVETQTAQQKQSALEMGKYLLAAKAGVPSGSDDLAALPKAMAQYVADKRRANPKWTPPADLTTQFLAAAQSPVTGLKATDIDRVSKMYTSDPQVKPLMARASQYQTALGALQSAAKGNKAASGSAYINVIKAIDQPTNLRFMMLDWAKSNIDPDFGNDIRKGFDKKFHGVIPPNVVRDMYQHMVDMRAADKTQLTNSYNWYLQHYPEAADKIKDPDTIFGKDEDYQLTSSGAALSDSVTNQLMKKYGLTPR